MKAVIFRQLAANGSVGDGSFNGPPGFADDDNAPALGLRANSVRIDRDRIGFFGFSMGGYTGLVVIGGNPDFRKDLPGCEGSSFRACEQLRNGEMPAEAPAATA